MKSKRFNAVEMKRRLQKEVEKKLIHLSESEILMLLHKTFGHLTKARKKRTHKIHSHDSINATKHKVKARNP